MAVSPVFHATRTELLDVLRLPAADVDNVSEVVDAEIQGARIEIYGRLGDARTAELIGFTYDENATSADGLDKLRARRLEAVLVRLRLTFVLPVLFMDAAESSRTVWNEDAFTREGPDPVRDLQETLRAEADLLVDQLLSSEFDDTQVGGPRVSSIAPDDDDVLKPFDTVRVK